MPNLSLPTNFSLDFVGELEKVNDLVSKVRALVYYKGGIRNGSWITDEFSEMLNSSLPFVPIVASYDSETEDFGTHADNGKKKAYGFVPANNNLAWEKSEKDGRDYLATDVYLWTGYWEEAGKIVEKQLSMELNKDTLSGEWKVINGDYYFIYYAGSFKGICALGDTITPCFEGASFYELDEESRNFFSNLNKTPENIFGGNKMEDKEVNVTEQEIPAESTAIETTETPAEETNEEFENSVTRTVVTNTTETVETTEGYQEETTVNQEITTTTKYPEYTSVDEAVDAYELKLTEVQAQLDSANAQLADYAVAQAKITEYEEKIAKLIPIQVEYEKSQKLEIIKKFEGKLSKEKITEFVESLETITTDELTTKLSLSLAEQVLGDAEFNTETKNDFVPTVPTITNDGVASIIRKHKEKK